MSKNEINSLGSVYGKMLNVLKKDLIKEGKIGPDEIGEAGLEDGGPTEEGGFVEAEVDVEKLSSKQEDNLYNINNLSYTSSYMPEEDEEHGEEETDEADAEEDEEKPDYIDIDKDGDKKESMKKAVKDAEEKDEDGEHSEEDEESLQFSEKIAQDGLNNFMSKKSYFDRLYENVMGDDLPGGDMGPDEELDALGIDDDSAEGDDVTITVSRDIAKTLCDLLQGAMGEDEHEDGDEDGAEEAGIGFEEDEEGIDTGSTHSGKYDDGKNNKVGDLKPAGGASEKGTSATLDNGSAHSGSYDDGKSNKVGDLKTSDRAFD